MHHQIESEVRSYCRSYTAVFERAAGAHMYSLEGAEYLDFLSGCGALNYGHNNPVLRDALLGYIQSGGIAMSMDMHTRSKSEFIDAFDSLILRPRKMNYRLQFTGPTGADAVEAAIKLARKVTGRTNVIAFTNGFHGCTLGALALTGNSHHRAASASLLSQVSRFPYDGYLGAGTDTCELLQKMLEDPSSGCDKPAAIILETVQGEGGLNHASAPWLRKLATVAKRNDILVIIDDIQAGCGRSGTFFSFEHMGVEPDMITMATARSGFGLPMSMVLIKPELDHWLPGEHNGTFRGNNFAFVTARVALEHYWADDTFAQRLNSKIEVLRSELSTLAHRYGFYTKGRGFMQGIDLRDGALADAVSARCFAAGLIVETCGPKGEVLKLLPPLTISEADMLDGIGRIEAALQATLSQPILANA